MSWLLAEAPENRDASHCDPVDLVIVPRARDLGDFKVRRALPSKGRQMVGPFIFFDQMGPTVLEADQAIDVRPHPHIGLSTITWLFEGEIHHRDSLGHDQIIRPGEVNWMTAGAGIVHSERSPDSARGTRSPLAGIQSWVALPEDREEMDPGFSHYPASDIPRFSDKDVSIALIAGSAWGKASPVTVQSDTLYADISVFKHKQFAVPSDAEERALYIYGGEIEIAGTVFKSGTMVVLKPGEIIPLKALMDTRMILLGGSALESPRYLYWNFVSSSKKRIEKAKNDWKEGRFPKIDGDDEFIPLPTE